MNRWARPQARTVPGRGDTDASPDGGAPMSDLAAEARATCNTSSRPSAGKSHSRNLQSISDTVGHLACHVVAYPFAALVRSPSL